MLNSPRSPNGRLVYRVLTANRQPTRSFALRESDALSDRGRRGQPKGLSCLVTGHSRRLRASRGLPNSLIARRLSLHRFSRQPSPGLQGESLPPMRPLFRHPQQRRKQRPFLPPQHLSLRLHDWPSRRLTLIEPQQRLLPVLPLRPELHPALASQQPPLLLPQRRWLQPPLQDDQQQPRQPSLRLLQQHDPQPPLQLNHQRPARIPIWKATKTRSRMKRSRSSSHPSVSCRSCLRGVYVGFRARSVG